jgi:tRNA threonylcarbamoyladenosine biosynthesis protein TsaB
MNLLAFDASSGTASIALGVAQRLGERSIAEPREQGARLLPLVDELLAEHGIELGALDAIVFGRGPGSFTGLRLAAATAQGLAISRRLPLVPVSSLAALAQQASDRLAAKAVLVCVDAHMGEVYWARYVVEQGIVVLAGEERLAAPAAVPQQTDAVGVGSGFARYPELAGRLAAPAAAHPDFLPRAADLLPFARRAVVAGEHADPATLTPIYLRGESAWRQREERAE